MKKIIYLSFFFSFTYLFISAQSSQFIITDKFDTVYYTKVNPAIGQKITGHKANGEKVKYEAKNVLYYLDEDGLQEVITKETVKGWKKGWDCMQVKMRTKEDARILLHTEMTANYGTKYIYYFFDKDGFVSEVDKKNIEGIISKYFSDCQDIVNEVRGKKGKQMFKEINLLAKLHVENCDPLHNVGVKTFTIREK